MIAALKPHWTECKKASVEILSKLTVIFQFTSENRDVCF